MEGFNLESFLKDPSSHSGPPLETGEGSTHSVSPSAYEEIVNILNYKFSYCGSGCECDSHCEAITRIINLLDEGSGSELDQPVPWLQHQGTIREVLIREASSIESLTNHGYHSSNMCSCLIPDMLRAIAGEPYDSGNRHRPWCKDTAS